MVNNLVHYQLTEGAPKKSHRISRSPIWIRRIVGSQQGPVTILRLIRRIVGSKLVTKRLFWPPFGQLVAAPSC